MHSQLLRYKGFTIQPDPKRPGAWCCATGDEIWHGATVEELKALIDDAPLIKGGGVSRGDPQEFELKTQFKTRIGPVLGSRTRSAGPLP
jgi:hypothetical protein